MTPRWLVGLSRLLIVGTTLALAGLSTSAWLPSRQAAAWSPPLALSPNLQSAWFPDIAADATGRVHTVWSTSLNAGVGHIFDVVIYASSPDGVSWSNPMDIVALPSKGAVTRPTLLADDQAWLH